MKEHLVSCNQLRCPPTAGLFVHSSVFFSALKVRFDHRDLLYPTRSSTELSTQMVKREKSPEINEDIRLFVVWIPYPLNPNWVYEQDVQDCAKWVAEVIDNEYYLISIHQKPSVWFFLLLLLLLFPFHNYFTFFSRAG